MSNLFRSCCLLLTLFLAFSMDAALVLAESSAELTEKIIQLQKKYQQLHSLEFDFSQATLTNGRTKRGNGNAIFYRMATAPTKASSPTSHGVMRWNYSDPTAQIIINDGKELTIYTPQDKQLIISPAQEMNADITYALFTGTKNLTDEFAPAPADRLFALSDSPPGYEAVLLTPRQPQPQVKRVQVWFSRDMTLHRLLMEDHFGALTELTFSNIRFNGLPTGDAQQLKTLLQLNLAPGTETIRQ